MAFISKSVYILYSSAAPTIVLDLVGASVVDGTLCQGWTEIDDHVDMFGQQWLITDVEKQKGVYTLRNLRSGTYLGLNNGSGENGNQVQGQSLAEPAGPSERNQHWRITQAGTNFRLQNVASGNYLDLGEENPVPGTKAQASQYASVATQEWCLRRVSRFAKEITEIIKKSDHIDAKSFRSYLSDGLYIILNENIRNEVYKGTGLENIKWRKQTFDCDDYSLIAKAEVSKWGNTFLRADGIAILFGVMFGKKAGGGRGEHAYNWYLNKELDGIMFFEPQHGTEMADIGYDGYMGIF